MKTTEGVVLSLTKHAKKQAKAKDFPISSILAMWENSPTINRSRSYTGQFRVCGDGICLVGVPKGGRGTSPTAFVVITVYLDQELTPPRQDQLKTRKGKRYAQRYYEGEGRG